MLRPIVFLVSLAVHTLRALFRNREDLIIENLALRQQVITLKKKRPRPQLDDMDRAARALGKSIRIQLAA